MPEWSFDIFQDLTYADAETAIGGLWDAHCNEKKYSRVMNIIDSRSLQVLIRYPGKKKRGDYRLECNNISTSHAKMCENLVNYIKLGLFEYDEIKHVLEDTYRNGYVAVNRRRERHLRALLFWLTLQENTNYPGYEGKLMPYKRYAEAIDTTLPGSLVSLDDVLFDASPDHARAGIVRVLQDPPYYYR